MSTVIGRYNDYLNVQQMSLDSYTTRRLKLRLKKHFGDNIAFHQPYDRTKSELLYSSAISLQYVINSASKCNAASTERMSCEQPSVEMVAVCTIVSQAWNVLAMVICLIFFAFSSYRRCMEANYGKTCSQCLSQDFDFFPKKELFNLFRELLAKERSYPFTVKIAR